MKQPAIKTDIFDKLQKDILSLQGIQTPAQSKRVDFKLGPIEKAFPNQVFPTGAVHEMISKRPEDAAATTGFIAALLGRIMQRGGVSLWISQKRTLFPPALKFFGIDPDRVIFVDVKNEKDLLWMVEESLKCQALSGVVAEIRELSLTDSRRLQLAVEKSRVTGLLHRMNPSVISNSACAARWKVTPLASGLEEDMPGVGFFRWDIALLKVRNGYPGQWQVQWTAGSFDHLVETSPTQAVAPDHDLLKTG
jgi:protein ImuA